MYQVYTVTIHNARGKTGPRAAVGAALDRIAGLIGTNGSTQHVPGPAHAHAHALGRLGLSPVRLWGTAGRASYLRFEVLALPE